MAGSASDLPILPPSPDLFLAMHEAPAAGMVQGTRHITLEEAGLTPAVDDPYDPLGYAKRFGITPEELTRVDREVRYTRFNPTLNTVDNIEHIEKRLRNENRLGARGIAQVLYKNGARSIWILANGAFFYGPEQVYLERMRVPTVEQALALIRDI